MMLTPELISEFIKFMVTCPQPERGKHTKTSLSQTFMPIYNEKHNTKFSKRSFSKNKRFEKFVVPEIIKSNYSWEVKAQLFHLSSVGLYSVKLRKKLQSVGKAKFDEDFRLVFFKTDKAVIDNDNLDKVRLTGVSEANKKKQTVDGKKRWNNQKAEITYNQTKALEEFEDMEKSGVIQQRENERPCRKVFEGVCQSLETLAWRLGPDYPKIRTAFDNLAKSRFKLARDKETLHFKLSAAAFANCLSDFLISLETSCDKNRKNENVSKFFEKLGFLLLEDTYIGSFALKHFKDIERMQSSKKYISLKSIEDQFCHFYDEITRNSMDADVDQMDIDEMEDDTDE